MTGLVRRAALTAVTVQLLTAIPARAAEREAPPAPPRTSHSTLYAVGLVSGLVSLGGAAVTRPGFPDPNTDATIAIVPVTATGLSVHGALRWRRSLMEHHDLWVTAAPGRVGTLLLMTAVGIRVAGVVDGNRTDPPPRQATWFWPRAADPFVAGALVASLAQGWVNHDAERRLRTGDARVGLPYRDGPRVAVVPIVSGQQVGLQVAGRW